MKSIKTEQKVSKASLNSFEQPPGSRLASLGRGDLNFTTGDHFEIPPRSLGLYN